MEPQQVDKGKNMEGLRQMPPIQPVPFMKSTFLPGHPGSPRIPRPTLEYIPIRLPSSANINYSERHRVHRSEKRKHLEGHTTGAAGVTPILAHLPRASAVNGAHCSNSIVAERQMKNLHSAIPNSLAIQRKRMLAMQENPLSDSLSMDLPNFLFPISSIPENIALAPSLNEMSQKQFSLGVSTGGPSGEVFTDISGITTDYYNCAPSSNLDLNLVPLDTSLGSMSAGEVDLNLSLGSMSAGEVELNQVPIGTNLDSTSASGDDDALWDEFLISDIRNRPTFFSELPPYIMEWLAKEIKLE